MILPCIYATSWWGPPVVGTHGWLRRCICWWRRQASLPGSAKAAPPSGAEWRGHSSAQTPGWQTCLYSQQTEGAGMTEKTNTEKEKRRAVTNECDPLNPHKGHRGRLAVRLRATAAVTLPSAERWSENSFRIISRKSKDSSAAERGRMMISDV